MSNQILSAGFYTPIKMEAFDSSIFSEHMAQDSQEVLEWALNVTQKAYDKGFVPNYIERNKSEEISDDQDYVDFWAAITIVFSYVVNLTRQVGLENPTQQIFFSYLEQKNMFNAPTELLVDLSYIAENYYDQIRKRGTSQIYKKSGVNPVDGEILRIVDYKIDRKDEFNFIYQEPYSTGWVVDRSSPLYCNSASLTMANKAYEPKSMELGVVDINLYPIIGTPIIAEVDGKSSFQLTSGQGLGGVDLDFEIPINPSLPYQVSFMVRGSGNFHFGCKFFDVDGVEISSKDCLLLTDQNYFFIDGGLNVDTVWHQVTAIIFPYTFLNVPSDISKPNLGIGRNLISTRNIRSLIPQILCSFGTINIYGLTVSVADLGYQTSFIHPANFINIISVNRNGKLSNFDIVEAIRYYMIPYDSILAVKFVENLDEPEETIDINLTEFLLNKTNQGIISGTNLLLYTT